MPRKSTSKTGEHEAAGNPGERVAGGRRSRGATVEVPALSGASVPPEAVAPPWVPALRLRWHDRYLLEAWVGLESGGAIYQARDASEGDRPVEVVVFDPALSGPAVSASNRERLERLLAFVSPHLGTTLDVAARDGMLFLVAEPRPAASFREWRATAQQPLSGILKTFSHFLLALEAIHDAGTFHGALGPTSFRVVDGRGVVVPPWWLDAAGVEPEGLPEAPWRAPELSGAGRPTPAADLRALGLLLGEALLGGAPATEAPHWPALTAGTPVTVGADVVPAELGPVLARALDPDPGGRFPSVAAFRQALEQALGPLWAEVARPATTRFLASLPMRQSGGRPLSALTARLARPTSLLTPVEGASPLPAPPRPPPVDTGADTMEGLALAAAAQRAAPSISSHSSTLDFVAPPGDGASPPPPPPDEPPPPPPPVDDGTLAGTVAEAAPPWANLAAAESRPPWAELPAAPPPPPEDPTVADLLAPEAPAPRSDVLDTVAAPPPPPPDSAELPAPPPSLAKAPAAPSPPRVVAPPEAPAATRVEASPEGARQLAPDSAPRAPAPPSQGLLETESGARRRPQVHVQPPPSAAATPELALEAPPSRRGLFVGLGLAAAALLGLGLVFGLSGDAGPPAPADAGAAIDAAAQAPAPAPPAASAPDVVTPTDAAPEAPDADTPPGDGASQADAALADAGPAAAAVGGPPPILDPEAVSCPPGMSKSKRKLPAEAGQPVAWEVYCIDRLEFPGGGVPTVNVDVGAARGLCAGRKKRLCTRSEWRRGCGGRYPYGAEFEQDRCHLVSASGAGQPPVATGSKTGCRSGLGLADMVGNVAEWTADGSVNGGSSLKDGENATCDLTSRRAGGAPHIGFRCCADPIR